jgi:hypothetical protein
MALVLVRAARALRDLRDEVVFVGGAVVDLFITDPAAPRPRFTEDVDVVVEVTTHGEWSGLVERLPSLGFRRASRRGSATRAAASTPPLQRLRGPRPDRSTPASRGADEAAAVMLQQQSGAPAAPELRQVT